MHKAKYRINWVKLAETLVATAGIIFLLWVAQSWIDIVVDNTTTAQHANWNLFVLLTK